MSSSALKFEPDLEIEEKIRAGKLSEVAEGLQKESPERSRLSLLGNYAWRCELAELGARWLFPVVRGNNRQPADATNEEKAEYAMCLLRLGAIAEARIILKDLDTRKSLLYQAAIEISSWNYQSARPLLTKYIEAEPDPYFQLVALSNLAACEQFVQEYDLAEMTIKKILSRTGSDRHPFLRFAALENLLQVQYHRANWQDFDQTIRQLRALNISLKSTESLLFRKWDLFSKLVRATSKDCWDRLDSFRKEMSDSRKYEIVRQCDEIEAKLKEETPLLNSLYFGTSWKAYRNYLIAEYGDRWKPAETYLWKLGEPAYEDVTLLVETGQSQEVSITYRAFSALCRDFYRPSRVAFLHTHIYPDEFYNPESGPNRVYQCIHTLRSSLESAFPGLEILETTQGYRLSSSKGYAIHIPQDANAISSPNKLMNRLQDLMKGSAFSATQAAKALDIPSRTMRRRLNEAAEAGHIRKYGATSQTRYRFE